MFLVPCKVTAQGLSWGAPGALLQWVRKDCTHSDIDLQADAPLGWDDVTTQPCYDAKGHICGLLDLPKASFEVVGKEGGT